MNHPYLTEWRESRLSEWRETDMAERITLEAPELRPCNQVAAVTTSTGLLIGCNYRRPMPQPSADAERATAAALQDAIAQAQAERPDLWTPETIERAKTAALIAAAGRK